MSKTKSRIVNATKTQKSSIKKVSSRNKKTAVIILPTYNESENIAQTLTNILLQQKKLSEYTLHILVVDDKSPDGTATIVRDFISTHQNIHLILGDKQGLGVAYKRGITHAINTLGADCIFEMDADGSHDPELIPTFLNQLDEGYTFIIGSRYVEGGSIPEKWPTVRKLNSRFGNLFANIVAGLKGVKDATSGYRCIDTQVMKKINLDNLKVKGYGFQINILHEALKQDAVIKEIPIHFKDRELGISKMSFSDQIGFVLFSLKLRFSSLQNPKLLVIAGIIGVIVLLLFSVLKLLSLETTEALTISLVTISLVLVTQGLFTLYLSLYTWADPKRVHTNRSPKKFSKPKKSFTALLPARNEENVIAHTIQAVHSIDYPEELKETIVICRKDDVATVAAAKKAIKAMDKKNIRIIHDSLPTSKPMKLNIGAGEAKNEVICIFDAEDEPHKDIYNIVNTVMVRKNADVVQSGVQLMNFASHWFSALNVLEYYFWFKSALRFFAKVGLITLGGNTVFFKKEWIQKIGGWDEGCLTEDADVGLRLSKMGAKIEVLYDQEHATQEETPHNLENFIKQRTRWNQGFIQVLLKGEWLSLPKISQKFLAFYLLFWPIVQSLLFLYIPISLGLMFFIKLPVWATMITILPVYMLALHLITIIVAFYQFVKEYKLPYSKLFPLHILLWYFPYQFVLGLSAYRAVYRLVSNQASWEKTTHINAHRKTLAYTNN